MSGPAISILPQASQESLDDDDFDDERDSATVLTGSSEEELAARESRTVNKWTIGVFAMYC